MVGYDIVCSGCAWSKHLPGNDIILTSYWTRAGEVTLNTIYVMFQDVRNWVLHIMELVWAVGWRTTHVSSLSMLLFSAPERNWTFRFCYISSSYAYMFLRFLRLFGLNVQILTIRYLRNTNVLLISFTYVSCMALGPVSAQRVHFHPCLDRLKKVSWGGCDLGGFKMAIIQWLTTTICLASSLQLAHSHLIRTQSYTRIYSQNGH